LLLAAKRDGREELSVWHVGEAVFIPVDTHESLGAGIVGRDFIVGERPMPVSERREAQAVAGPAERAATDSLQKSVIRPIADAGEVVALASIAEQIPASACRRQTLTHPLFQIAVRRAVRVVVDATAQPGSGLDQGDLQARGSQRVDCNTAPRSAADYANVKFPGRHGLGLLVFHSTTARRVTESTLFY